MSQCLSESPSRFYTVFYFKYLIFWKGSFHVVCELLKPAFGGLCASIIASWSAQLGRSLHDIEYTCCTLQSEDGRMNSFIPCSLFCNGIPSSGSLRFEFSLGSLVWGRGLQALGELYLAFAVNGYCYCFCLSQLFISSC